MRRALLVVAAASAAVAAPALANVRGLPGGPNGPQPIVTFAPGSFPESLAVRGGSLYVTLGFAGEVAKVTVAGGTVETYGTVPRGDGLLTGLAFDGDGNLFVASATFAADPAPGVWKIPAGGGTPVRVLTLPAESFPNGLAFRDGELYVSDSALGAIWRFRPTAAATTPSAPWYESGLLAPGKSIGANGIAFDATGKHLYVAVADAGRIVRLTIAGGHASSAEVVVEQAQLRSADGVAFDANGDLYVSVNDTNRLYRVSPTSGALTLLADRSAGLAYPTQPAFDTVRGSTLLYLTNGALANGVADVVAFDVGVGGQRLP